MSRYLDPKNDIVFRKIFGEHAHLLMSFLNAVLPLPADSPIVKLDYLEREHVPHFVTLKRTIADVKCTDEQGRVFIVEMQMNWTDSFKQRLLFGASQAIATQLDQGEDYKLLQPVYGLGLIAAIFDKTDPDWYHHYRLTKKGKPDGEVIDQLQLIFIELPKFPVHSSEEKQRRLLWLRFLREINERTETVSEELTAIPEIAEAMHFAERAAFTKGQITAYNAYWDAVRVERTMKADGYAEGEAKGYAKGEAKGLVQGRAEGIELVAVNMLRENKSIEEITRLTGLSLQTIVALRDTLV